MIYSVTFYNKYECCDITRYVKANTRWQAALAVHAHVYGVDQGRLHTPFEFEDYTVCEFVPDELLKSDELLKTVNDSEILEAKKRFVLDKWNHCGYKNAENGLNDLLSEVNNEFQLSDVALVKWIAESEKGHKE